MHATPTLLRRRLYQQQRERLQLERSGGSVAPPRHATPQAPAQQQPQVLGQAPLYGVPVQQQQQQQQQQHQLGAPAPAVFHTAVEAFPAAGSVLSPTSTLMTLPSGTTASVAESPAGAALLPRDGLLRVRLLGAACLLACWLAGLLACWLACLLAADHHQVSAGVELQTQVVGPTDRG